MKGIILAGGTGSRLFPLTKAFSKHLLPIHDKPMIYYPLSTLMLAGITDILIITTEHDLPLFIKLLGDGSQWGLSLNYCSQHKPQGIAQSFILAEQFIDNDNVCLILGDNIFYGYGLSALLQHCVETLNAATILGYYVDDPERYGVVEFDKNQRVKQIHEKPEIAPSNYAITGLYFYNNEVVDIAKSIKPSARGELEITDVNNVYLSQGKMQLEIFGRGHAWLDTGTPSSLLEASQFVAITEKRQGQKIACLEEIAWRRGFISFAELEVLANLNEHKKTPYGQYLSRLVASGKETQPSWVLEAA